MNPNDKRYLEELAVGLSDVELVGGEVRITAELRDAIAGNLYRIAGSSKVFTPDIRAEVSFYVRNGKPYVGVKDGPELLLTEENCDEWQVRASEYLVVYDIRHGIIYTNAPSPLCYLTDLKAWVLGLKEAQK